MAKVLLRAQFQEEKALAATLYVAGKLREADPWDRADLYKLLKILYFADKNHLVKYNRSIAGDYYVALSHGPVPSRTYDMMKFIRGDGYFLSHEAFIERLKSSFRFTDHITVSPLAEADLEELSETDIECLDEAIERYKGYSFHQLKQESHDQAYKKADQDDCMSLEEIARAAGANETIVGYVKNWLENENSRFAQ